MFLTRAELADLTGYHLPAWQIRWPVAWRYENKNVKGNWYITWTKPDYSFNQRGLHERKQP